MIKLYYDQLVEAICTDILKVDFKSVKDVITGAVKANSAAQLLEIEDSPLFEAVKVNEVETLR
jgi:hypothetical protein